MKQNALILMVLAVVLGLAAGPARADNGTWLGNSGNWSDPAIWASGTVATGTDATAFFTGVNITAATTVTVDTAWMIGNTTFTDDTTASHDLTIAGGANTLTLDVSSGSPVLNVTQNGRSLTIRCALAGDDGLAKSGAGTLVLFGANTFTGAVVINQRRKRDRLELNGG